MASRVDVIDTNIRQHATDSAATCRKPSAMGLRSHRRSHGDAGPSSSKAKDNANLERIAPRGNTSLNAVTRSPEQTSRNQSIESSK